VNEFSTPIEFSVSNLIYCLKLWHKFNSHKEFLTVVTKCLSNSKLDLMAIYKNFIADYYNTYSYSLNLKESKAVPSTSLETVNEMEIKQKIITLINLFMNEKCDKNSFEVNY
jgi:hypothetical protein